MLSNKNLTEINNFLNRLQGKKVKVEVASRLNQGFHMGFTLKLDKSGDSFKLTSEKGEVDFSFKPSQAEGFQPGTDSVGLIYGDNLITLKYERKR